MKHLFLAAWLAATGITTATSIPVAVAAQEIPANVTGDWMVQITGDKFIAGTLHLTQVGNMVIGSAEAADGSGVLQISGKFAGTALAGKFRAPNGNVGWVTFDFNARGTSFNGQWGWGGRKPNGNIVSRLRVPTSF